MGELTGAGEAASRGHLPGWRVLVLVTFVLAGVLLAASAHAARGENLRSGDRGDLVSLIQGQQRQLDQLQNQVDQLRSAVHDAAQSASAGDATATGLQHRADQLGEPVGLVPMRGPGLTVELNDAPLPADGQSTQDGLPLDAYIVHEQDLQGVANALWRGGAEAMQVQDQRVISTSAIRCVGNTLLLQGRTYSPPYRITAIGDVDALLTALGNDQQVEIYREYVAQIGLGYKVTTHRAVTLPAYTGPLDLTYARVAR